MKLKHVAAVAGAITVAMSASGGLATADSSRHGGWRTVRVEFTPTNPIVANVVDVCDPANQCVQVSTVNAAQTGDLVGSTIQGSTIGSNGVNFTQFPQNVTGTFTGTVKGCGTGGLLYSGNGNFDATTGLSTMTYTIVAGTGTGELAGISGRLHQAGPLGAPVPIFGTLRCNPPR